MKEHCFSGIQPRRKKKAEPGIRFCFGKEIARCFCAMEGERSARHPSGRDVVAIPVAHRQRFNAHAGAGLWAVNEAVLSHINAGMVAGTGNTEHHNVAGTQTAPRDASAHGSLISADARHVNAVAGAGPVHKAGAVEPLGRGRATGNVGAAELTFGRGGNGGAAGAYAALRTVLRSVGLLSAGRKKQKGGAEHEERKTPEQREKAGFRHGDSSGGGKKGYQLFLYVIRTE